MAAHLVSSTPILAETLDPSFSDYSVTANSAVLASPWMFSSFGLGGVLIVVGLWCKLQCQKKQRALESAIAQNQALQQQLDLAIEGCQRWESLPDLLYARHVGLLCLEQPETSQPRSTRTRLSVGDRTPV